MLPSLPSSPNSTRRSGILLRSKRAGIWHGRRDTCFLEGAQIYKNGESMMITYNSLISFCAFALLGLGKERREGERERKEFRTALLVRCAATRPTLLLLPTHFGRPASDKSPARLKFSPVKSRPIFLLAPLIKLFHPAPSTFEEVAISEAVSG